jgi:hypothetical protein
MHKTNRFLERTAKVAPVFLLGVLGLVCPGAAAATPAQGPATDTPTANSNFAIADFDGDRKPDLATVDLDGFDAPNARYSIRFQLTGGRGQSIGVAAPFGGLHVAARDVNGDNALDLIISTAWLHRPVAILLNDGHGRFTVASPAAFPATVWDSPTGWEPATGEVHGVAALIRTGSSSGGCTGGDGMALPRQFPELLSLPNFCVSASPEQLSPFSRAPPTLGFHI